jgi:hypothetical protein
MRLEILIITIHKHITACYYYEHHFNFFFFFFFFFGTDWYDYYFHEMRVTR